MGCFSSNSSSGNNKVLIVVGPSGVGKDTLMAKVFEKNKDCFSKGVTHTSRKMRPGEKEGYNYYYVSQEEFLKMKDNNELVENNFYNGNYYGLSKKELTKGLSFENKIMYAIIDINGANAVHRLNIPAVFVAILPESEEVLEKRLRGRGTETEDKIQGRLNTAKEELKKISETSFFNYKVINDDLERARDELYNNLKNEFPFLK